MKKAQKLTSFVRYLTVIILITTISATALTSCYGGTSSESELSNNGSPSSINDSTGIVNYIETGDYSKAVELFIEKYQGNANKESEVEASITLYLNGRIADYAEEKISLETLKNILTTIKKANERTMIYDNLSFYAARAEDIENSKNAYSRAENYISKGNYAEAIAEYEQINEADTKNYAMIREKIEEAKRLYSENAFQILDEYLSTSKPLEAYSYLMSLDRAYIENSKAESYRYRIISEYEASLMEKCRADISSSGDYALGIKALNEFKEQFPDEVTSADFNKLANNTLNDYINDIIKVADNELASGDYKKAILTASGGLAIFNYSVTTPYSSMQENLEKKIEEYKTYIPVLLTDLEPSQRDDVGINSISGWTLSYNVDKSTYNLDTDGVKYDSVLMGTGENTGGSITYYINHKYTNLKGLVYRPYYSISGNGDSSYYDGWVKIYGDDVLLYESPKITEKTYTTYSFDVDVSSVRELTIVIGGAWYPGSGCIPTAGVANATLSKAVK